MRLEQVLGGENMTLTPEILSYTLLAYSVVFVLIGLFFFAYCIKTIYRVHDIVESVVNLIHRIENQKEYKHEGTD